MAENKTKFFTFKGLPLVRKGKQLYYGKMSDEYVSLLTILSSKKIGDIDVADKVRVQLILTSPKEDATDMVAKSSEQDGLYQALDLAHVWLSRA
ncbi:MAG: hypothetical protein GX346_07440 [Clostridiales bacterium]|nr:hypothetical protein [Clostridiales bacterium]